MEERRGYTLEQLFEKCRLDRAKKIEALQWGVWHYLPDLMVLRCDYYEVDLEQITSSAEMLDWIFQVNGKPWATGEVMKSLLDAMNDLLSPQGYYCSFGHNRSCDPHVPIDAFFANE